jgi:hypothetical protein
MSLISRKSNDMQCARPPTGLAPAIPGKDPQPGHVLVAELWPPAGLRPAALAASSPAYHRVIKNRTPASYSGDLPHRRPCLELGMVSQCPECRYGVPGMSG